MNTCYICFSMYEEDVREGTGREWRECVCGCSVHEDCIVDARFMKTVLWMLDS